MLPNAPHKQLLPLAAQRLGHALFQLDPCENVCLAERVGWHALGNEGRDAPAGSTTLATLDRILIGPDLLGTVHERLLGLDSRSDTHRKTTTRKATGAFYTPEYVTRYMVARAMESVRRDGDGKRESLRPTILDPACGCGAFLLTAYRYLREAWCRHHSGNDAWRYQRRKILRRLHGVDLDDDAVLATRRALWLAAADEPAGPLAADETNVFFETVRRGNALVGPTLDPLTGTFDLVLGNPPYRRERGAKTLLDQIAQTDFGRRWRTARMDLWYYFAHRALELMRDGGVLSLVVSGYWTAGSGAAKLVDQLRRETHVEEVFDLDRLPVFDRVVGQHLIFRARKTRGTATRTVVKRPARHQATSAEPFLSGRAPLVIFEKTAEELFHDGRLDLEPPADDLLRAIARGTPLGRLGRVRQGIAENPATVTRRTVGLLADSRAGQGVFVLAPEEVESLGLSDREKTLLRPYHAPRDVGRYRLARRPSRMLIYSTPETCSDIHDFPAIERHLARFRPIMEARRETRQGRRHWWHLHWPREASLWTADKILSVQMAARPSFAAVRGSVHVNFSVNVFVPDPTTSEHLLYLTALLNSGVLWQWYRHHAKRRGVGLEINGRVLAATPIRRIDFLDTTDRRLHDELVELAAAMMQANTPARDEIDGRIDTIVARLYEPRGT